MLNSGDVQEPRTDAEQDCGAKRDIGDTPAEAVGDVLVSPGRLFSASSNHYVTNSRQFP